MSISTIFSRKAGVTALIAAWLVAAAALLIASYIAYTNFKSGSSGDYARYTNMMWNTAHGRPFLYGLDSSYLAVHLSFTLGLLGFLFRVCDHPFLLTVVQWACMFVGSLLLAGAARHLRVPVFFTAALMFWWTAYHFTQQVVLCEFHGVCTYMLLIPWLYYCLVRSRAWVWIPFALILGLREEAGLMVIPLFLYFAVSERWRPGYYYAAAALAYVLIATFFLFPEINGITITQRRPESLTPPSGMELLSDTFFFPRLRSFAWVALPLLPFLWGRWRPVVVIPSLAVVTCLVSSYPSQFNLRIHYPAIIVACSAVAMLEVARRVYGREGTSRPALARICPVYLILVTLIGYWLHGFLWGSRPDSFKKVYQQPSWTGRHALVVATREVPKTGALATIPQLRGFVANRADLALNDMEQAGTETGRATVVFCFIDDTPASVVDALGRRAWGVRYSDNGFAVLEKGADTAKNEAFLRHLTQTRLRVAYAPQQVGEESVILGEGLVRHGHASAGSDEQFLMKNVPVRLGAGSYRAQLRLMTPTSGACGRIIIMTRGGEQLVEETIEGDGSGKFRELSWPFVLNQPAKVLTRIAAGRQPVWLNEIIFDRVDL